MGKRSGPAERLLQLLAGRWVPGAGILGTAEAGRGVRKMRESAQQRHMEKEHEDTTDTRMHTSAPRAGARAVQGKEPAALPSPSCFLPCRWRRPVTGAGRESTGSHAVKSWVGSSGCTGEGLKTLSWPLVSSSPTCLPGVLDSSTGPGLTALGNWCSQPGPWVSSLVSGPPGPPERMRIGPEGGTAGKGV